MKTFLFAAATLAALAPRARADQLERAQQIPDKARVLAERGRALHEAGDYTDAIAAFREAYVLAPSPGLLFNLAQSYRLAGRCDDAAWMYRRYLDSHPSPERKTIAENHLASVEKCGHGGLRVAIIPTALETPLPSDPPGAAAARSSASGATAMSDVSIASQPIEGPNAEREQRVGIAIGIGGAVVLTGAAYFAWEAHEESDAVSAAYMKGGKGTDVSGASQRGQHDAAMAEAFGVAGGIAVVSGTVVYLIGRHHQEMQHVQVGPIHGGGAAARVTWHF